ncbi:MAG: hypothetical protein ABI954_11765 [Pyrinomonadaceae bacterium]
MISQNTSAFANSGATNIIKAIIEQAFFNLNLMKKKCILLAILSVLTVTAVAQTRRKPRPKSVPKAATTTQTATPSAEVAGDEALTSIKVPAKKNERAENSMPTESNETTVPQKKNTQVNGANKANAAASQLPFNYEFAQPKFYITRVVIEHNAQGKGKITFQKQDLSDSLTDPLTISDKVLEKIQNLWTKLNLIESTENYQSPERNYAHLGTMKLRRWQGDMVREVEFNWTENQTVKDLTDEYKKLTEQYLWIFDMNVARENQPLNSPQLADRLNSLLNRNQISDPKQMLAYLHEVVDDERLPLIARNHTTKLIQRIEKLKEEK